MPFNDQNPAAHGWNRGAAASIVPFAYSSKMGIQSFGGAVTFPSGVAKGTEQIWTAFLDEIVPTISGGIKQGQCFGYEDRANVNNPSRASFHAYGLALDINSLDNPNKAGQGTNGSGKYKIGAGANAIASKYGMQWGGTWDDPMHFELHLTPDEVAAFPTGGISNTPQTPDTGSAPGILDAIKYAAPATAAIGVLLIGGIVVFTMT